MSETITPPDVPKTFLIPIETLYSGLRFLFADYTDVEGNVNDAHAFSEVFKHTAIHIVQKSFAYQDLDPMVGVILRNYTIPLEQFLTLLENISHVIETPYMQIEKSIEILRYHYIVDVNYQLVSNHTLRVDLITTLPSRNYSAVLRKEVLEARENDEFVPYKYLILAGLA